MTTIQFSLLNSIVITEMINIKMPHNTIGIFLSTNNESSHLHLSNLITPKITLAINDKTNTIPNAFIIVKF